MAVKSPKGKKRTGIVGRVSKIRSKIMSRVRSKNTCSEIILRKALFRLGLRFRIHQKSLLGRPDICFPSKKVAIFCDGDFWHGKNWHKRKKAGEFKVRREYWVNKIENNLLRDRKTNRGLRKEGWLVKRYWESDIKINSEKIAREIYHLLGKR